MQWNFYGLVNDLISINIGFAMDLREPYYGVTDELLWIWTGFTTDVLGIQVKLSKDSLCIDYDSFPIIYKRVAKHVEWVYFVCTTELLMTYYWITMGVPYDVLRIDNKFVMDLLET